ELPARVHPDLTIQNRTLFSMAFVLLLALGLEPLRRVVQNVVDRAFYRRRLDYRATIRSLSSVMTTLLDLREVVAQVTQVVTSALQLESTAVCLVDGNDRGTVFLRSGTDDAVVHQRDEPAVVSLTQLLQANPNEFGAQALMRHASIGA